jgi:hypothetical protein
MGKAQRAARHPEFPVNGPVGRPLLLAEQRVPGPVIRAECGLLPPADEESRQVRQAGVDLCEVPVAARFVAPIVGATTSYVTRSTLWDTGSPLAAFPSFVLRIRLASCSSVVPVHLCTVRRSRSIRLPQIPGRLALYAYVAGLRVGSFNESRCMWRLTASRVSHRSGVARSKNFARAMTKSS